MASLVRSPHGLPPGGCGHAALADDCVAAALAYAQRLADMPTLALVATRHLLRESTARTLNQQLDAERDTQSAMGKTHDYVEGVTAFREKRSARFNGT